MDCIAQTHHSKPKTETVVLSEGDGGRLNMGKGDRLIIEDFNKNDLEAGDFSFADVLV